MHNTNNNRYTTFIERQAQSSFSYLTIKPTRCTNFSIFLEQNCTCFGQLLCPSWGVQHCTHSSGICLTGYADCFLASSQHNLYVRCKTAVVQHPSSWTHSLQPYTWHPTTSNQALHTIGGNNTQLLMMGIEVQETRW